MEAGRRPLGELRAKPRELGGSLRGRSSEVAELGVCLSGQFSQVGGLGFGARQSSSEVDCGGFRLSSRLTVSLLLGSELFPDKLQLGSAFLFAAESGVSLQGRPFERCRQLEAIPLAVMQLLLPGGQYCVRGLRLADSVVLGLYSILQRLYEVFPRLYCAVSGGDRVLRLLACCAESLRGFKRLACCCAGSVYRLGALLGGSLRGGYCLAGAVLGSLTGFLGG